MGARKSNVEPYHMTYLVIYTPRSRKARYTQETTIERHASFETGFARYKELRKKGADDLRFAFEIRNNEIGPVGDQTELTDHEQ